MVMNLNLNVSCLLRSSIYDFFLTIKNEINKNTLRVLQSYYKKILKYIQIHEKAYKEFESCVVIFWAFFNEIFCNTNNTNEIVVALQIFSQ